MFRSAVIPLVAAGAIAATSFLGAHGERPARAGEAVWGPPRAISEPMSPANSIAVAVDEAANATAVWANGRGVWAARRPDDGHWHKPVRIARSGWSAQADADPRGNVTVVWSGSFSEQVMTARRLVGGGWTRPVALSRHPDNYRFADYLRIDVNSRGAAVVTWWYGDGDQMNDELGRVEAVYRSARGRWSPPHVLTRGVYEETTPVGIDARGNVTAAFADARGRVRAARRVIGRGWLSPVRVSTGRRNWWGVQVAVDPRGDATATWLRGERVMMAASRPLSERRWSAPVLLARAHDSRLAMDRAGTAWAAYAGPRGAIGVRTKPLRGGWRPPRTIAPANGDERWLGPLALNRDRDALLSWCQNSCFSSYRPHGGSWGSPQRLARRYVDTDEFVSGPEIGLYANGSGVAVGQRRVARALRVWAQTMAAPR